MVQLALEYADLSYNIYNSESIQFSGTHVLEGLLQKQAKCSTPPTQSTNN